MDFLARIKTLFDRNQIGEMIPVLVQDEGSHAFLIRGDDKGSFLGLAWFCNPLAGANDDLVTMLQSTYESEIPAGSFITTHFVSGHHIEHILARYEAPRTSHAAREQDFAVASLMNESTNRIVNMFRKGTKTALDKTSGVKAKDCFCIVTLKVPCAVDPSDEDMERIKTLGISIEQALETMYLHPHLLKDDEFKMVMQQIVKPDARMDREYDNHQTLNEQIFDNDDEVEVAKDQLRINNTHIRSLSVQRYPREMMLPIMGRLIGDPMGTKSQITCPFMLTTTIYFPDQNVERGSINSNARNIKFQSMGFIARFEPKIAMKNESFQELQGAIADGQKIVKVWTNLTIFGSSADECLREARRARVYYETNNFKISEDGYMTGPSFQSQLPLCIHPEAVKKSARFVTMTATMAAHCTPVIGEYKGNGMNAAILLVGRSGQVCVWDPYNSDTGYNCAVFGETGSGKSFIINHLLQAVRQRGGVVRIIDSGGSYKRLTKLMGGEFLQFDEASKPVINPFSEVTNINAELPPLIPVLEQMIAPRNGLSDYQIAMLERCTIECFNNHKQNMTVTDLADYLIDRGKAEDNKDVLRMGEQLFKYTRHGPYGRLFDGKSNITMEKAWSCLELDDLKNHPDVQAVVLMLLIVKLNKTFFQMSRSIPKIIAIDESWQLLASDKKVQNWIVGAIRVVRKLYGCVVIISQSVLDLTSEEGRISPIIQNSANLLLLKQKTETIDALRREHVLGLSDGWFEMLKTVRTVAGAYSEVFIYTSTRGYGIARFIVDRFHQLLYTTEPTEASKVESRILMGMNVIDAIRDVMREEGINDDVPEYLREAA